MKYGVRHRMNYKEVGKKYWEKFRLKLYRSLCIRSEKRPRKWAEELVSGDIREFIVALITILTTRYSIPTAIAIPLVALVVKMGLAKFCESAPSI